MRDDRGQDSYVAQIVVWQMELEYLIVIAIDAKLKGVWCLERILYTKTRSRIGWRVTFSPAHSSTARAFYTRMRSKVISSFAPLSMYARALPCRCLKTRTARINPLRGPLVERTGIDVV